MSFFGGGGTNTVTQNADPWAGSVPSLKRGLDLSNRLLDQRNLAPEGFQGNRLARFTTPQTVGMGNALDVARGGAQATDAAIPSLIQAMQGGPLGGAGMAGAGALEGSFTDPQQFNVSRNVGQVDPTGAARTGAGAFRVGQRTLQGAEGDMYRDFDAVRNNVLGGVIPNVMAQFSGGGMADSSMAVDTATRAATEALAPIEYANYQQSMNRNAGLMDSAMGRAAGLADSNAGRQTDILQNNANRGFAGEQQGLDRALNVNDLLSGNALRGAALAPGLDQAAYMPSQMQMQIGGMQQAQNQQGINADMQRFYEGANRPYDNLTRYMSIAQGTGGLGGTSSQTQPGASMGGQLAGSALTGLGAYGALAMNPATAPFALGGGLLAGAMGLF